MSKHLLTLLIAVSLLAGGCAPSKPPYQPPAEPVSIPARSFMKQWSYDLGERVGQIAAIHVIEDLLFVRTEENNVYVMTRESGELRFIRDVTGRHDRIFPPVLAGDWIIIPTHTQLKMYDRTTGRERIVDLELSVSTPAVYGDERLFFGTDFVRAGRIIAADPLANFSPIVWQVMTRSKLTAGPAFFGEVVYFGGEDGYVYAVSSERGQVWATERTSFNARGPILADLAVDNFGVYVSVSNGVLYVLDRTTGKIKWQYFADRGLRTAPVPGAQLVYQYAKGTGLVAIDKLQGEFTRMPRWTLAEGVQVLSEDADRVYVRSRGNRILAVNKTDGEIVFQSERDDFRVFSTNLQDSTIYAATAAGQVYAIRPVLTPGQIGELVLLETEIGGLAAAE